MRHLVLFLDGCQRIDRSQFRLQAGDVRSDIEYFAASAA